MVKQFLLVLWGAWASFLHTLIWYIRPKPLPLPSNRSVRSRAHNVPGPAHSARTPSNRLGLKQASVALVQQTSKYPFWINASDAATIASGRQQFQQQFHSLGYDSYGPGLEALRSSQFRQLTKITYLDHAATTLYAVQQLLSANQELSEHLFANPHSQLGGSFDHTPAAIKELRLLTLQMLNALADEYEVIFTSGATAALKLAGETFPWAAGSSCCAYTTVNHNSALGIRQLALAAGATIQPVNMQQLLQQQQRNSSSTCQVTWQQQQEVSPQSDVVHNLFIVPAECNFSGSRYEPQVLLQLWQQQQQQKQQQHWWLLVDAAKACSSHPPDLSTGVVDMLALSYYKIFGHPTGLGALVVRRALLPLLLPQKAYFGGGTVELSVADQLHVVRRKGAAGFEDGTLPFTSIAAARHGFKQLMHLNAHNTLNHILQYQRSSSTSSSGGNSSNDIKSNRGSCDQFNTCLTMVDQGPQQQQLLLRGSFARIDRHVACLTWFLVDQLLQLQHSNGQKAAVLYCQPAVQDLFLQWQGAVSTLADDAAHLHQHDTESSSSSGGGGGGSSSDDAHLQQEQRRRRQKHWTTVPVDEDSLSRFQALQGPVVCFNLLRPDGSWVGHREVAKLALIHGICLRTGCFCNPGACAYYLHLAAEDQLAHHAAGHVCWDDHDIIDGRPTGAVRVSFGYMSSYDDLALLLLFLRKFFVDNDGVSAPAAAADAAQQGALETVKDIRGSSRSRSNSLTAQKRQHNGGAAPAIVGQVADVVANGTAVPPGPSDNGSSAGSTTEAGSTGSTGSTTKAGSTGSKSYAGSTIEAGSTGSTTEAGSTINTAVGRLSAVYLYPIKSCAPQKVSSWPLGPNGLLFDREWALCGPDGTILTQKRVPCLTQVRPEVDLEAGVLRVTKAGMSQQLVVSLGSKLQQQQQRPALQEQQVQICGDTICSKVIVGEAAGLGVSSSAAAAAQQSPRSHAAAAATAAGLITTDAQAWFTAASGVPCKLVQQLCNSRTVKLQQHRQQQQQQPGHRSSAGCTAHAQDLIGRQTLGFANEGQYLLVNQASVDVVGQQLAAADGSTGSGTICVTSAPDALRFRPNLVVEGFAPWAEDSWSSIEIYSSSSSSSSTGGCQNSSSSCDGAASHPVCSSATESIIHCAHGADDNCAAVNCNSSSRSAAAVVLDIVQPCGRCDMIQVDQVTGQRHGRELLSLLAQHRRQRGKLNFGVLLAHRHDAPAAAAAPGVQWLRVGDAVQAVVW